MGKIAEKRNAVKEKVGALIKRRQLKSPQSGRKKAHPSAPPVIILHGLGVPRYIMSFLAWKLSRKYGRRVYNIPFNTRTADIPEIASQVSRFLKDKNINQFDAVTHSTGGIILRWLVNNHEVPPLRRAVQICPPNNGSWIASKLHEKLGWLYPFIWGQTGLQLRKGNHGICETAGPIEIGEVGIIAGGNGTPKGVRNFFKIPGDNDGTVAVEETIMPGMKDFLLLNYDHTTILFSSQTAHMVNLFLEHGVFRPEMTTGHE
jgi:triacylglycerol lipase